MEHYARINKARATAANKERVRLAKEEAKEEKKREKDRVKAEKQVEKERVKAEKQAEKAEQVRRQ